MGGGGSSNSNKTPAGSFSWQGGGGSNFSPEQFNKTMGGDILAAYKQGPADTFDKSLYTGLSGTTQQGLSGLLDAANRNAGMFDPGIDYTTGLLGGGGLAGGQAGNIGTVNDIGGQFGGIAAGATDPSLTENQLMDVATGGAFGMNDPGYARLRQNLADDTLGGVNASFLTDGRFGSGIHVDTAVDSLGDVLAGLDYSNYQNDIARQERALGAIEGQRQQGLLNRMGALGAQAGAAGNAFNMEQQGVANAMGATAALPGLFDASLQPARTVLGVGQARDADAQAKRLAEYERFQRTNDPVFNHIAKYQGLLGQQAGNPQPERGPGLFDWLGLGIAGAGALL